MDAPLFSQIPAVVLKKVGPEGTLSRKRKAVKFYDDDDLEQESEEAISEEVTSSGHATESQESHRSSNSHKSNEIRTLPIKSALKKTKKRKASPDKELIVDEGVDAITQTNPEPAKISRQSQTDIVFPVNLTTDDSIYDDYTSRLQAQSLEFRPNILPIPKRDGKQPPLKIGLILPKGKKRVVFYPDESYQ